MDKPKVILIVRESNICFPRFWFKKKTLSKSRLNEYTYLLKYIKEKDTLCKKSHLEEK